MTKPTESTALTKATESKFTEYIPFGAQDKIKLSIAMVQNLIAVKTKSGKTCSENDAIKFVAMCSARRLNPFEGDAFLIGYDTKDGGATFSLITAHQAFLKRAELNQEYDGMKSGLILERNGEVIDVEGDFFLQGDKLLGGWATVFFKNRKQPMHKRVRLERFKKPFGIWLDDPAGMICKCAEADALRSSFPTMLGGLYLKEEVLQQPDPKVTTPIFTPNVTTVEATPPAEGNPNLKPEGILEQVVQLCKRDNIAEVGLLQFMDTELGIATSEAKFLEDVDPDSLILVRDNWDDIAKRMKEAMP